MALGPSPTLTGHMYSDVLYSFTIGFVGAILFLLVDKYEPEGPLARLLKFSDPVRRWRRNPAQVAALRFGWRCSVCLLLFVLTQYLSICDSNPHL